jgi:transcriptional regulator with XRE-family HTH domain
MPVSPERLGRHIRRIREQRGWTLEELAERMGVSANTVRRIERGQSQRPHVHTLSRLANAFGVALEHLLDEASRELG